jgi:hypothetical protein
VAAYSHFLGSKVNVQYRFGDIVLSASGTFVGDSGRSIFLEQHLEQRGKLNYFRWEIPYPYMLHIEAEPQQEAEEPAAGASSTYFADQRAAAAAAGESASVARSILPLPQRPKTA